MLSKLGFLLHYLMSVPIEKQKKKKVSSQGMMGVIGYISMFIILINKKFYSLVGCLHVCGSVG